MISLTGAASVCVSTCRNSGCPRQSSRPGARPEPFLPEQRITMDEAIDAYTAGSAWIGHREDHTGRIKVGFDADLAVVDRPLETADDAFAARVDLTMVQGKVVYEAS